MYLNTEPKTSEALHLRISVNSAMTYSNKVYTAETKDEKGVAKVEFSTELFLHPFVIRCQQTGEVSTEEQATSPASWQALFPFPFFSLTKHSKSLYELTKIDSHASYL